MHYSLLFYYLYITILFLVIFIEHKPTKYFCYIVGLLALCVCNSELETTADLKWYRQIYEEINFDNCLNIIQNNDFEFLFFLTSVIEKEIFNTNLSSVILILLSVPIFSKSFRKNIDIFSIFLITPGAFLLINNVIRQGAAEYYFLWSLFSGSIFLNIASISLHRFSLVITLATKLSLKANLYLIIPIFFIAVIYYLTHLDQSILDAYDKLEFSYLSFILKIFTVLSPLIVYALKNRRNLNLTQNELKSIFVLLLLSFCFLGINGRMADRAVLFLYPYVLYVCFHGRRPKNFKYAIALLMFSVSLFMPFQISHLEFFEST
jgi:hypothetical protein